MIANVEVVSVDGHKVAIRKGKDAKMRSHIVINGRNIHYHTSCYARDQHIKFMQRRINEDKQDANQTETN